MQRSVVLWDLLYVDVTVIHCRLQYVFRDHDTIQKGLKEHDTDHLRFGIGI